MKKFFVVAMILWDGRMDFIIQGGDYATWTKNFKKATHFHKRSDATYLQRNLAPQYTAEILILSIEK